MVYDGGTLVGACVLTTAATCQVTSNGLAVGSHGITGVYGGDTGHTGSTSPAIVPGSPAERAGLKSGDIITAVNDVAVDGAHPLQDLLVQFSPGTDINLTILRDGERLVVALTLGTRPNK